MLTFSIQLHGDLADLVSGPAKSAGTGPIGRSLTAPTTVKDALEAIGIPHCEVGDVVVHGRGRPARQPAALDRMIVEGDELTVRPVAPRGEEDPRFLCDQHLGRLARMLRILGFDTLWDGTWLEPEVARRTLNTGRIVLSRSRGLLKRKVLNRAMLIRDNDPQLQTTEVVRRYRLAGQVSFLGRCSLCNGVLRAVDRGEVADRIPPRTARWLNEYYLCTGCDQLYWSGTHVQALKDSLARILIEAETA